jgi:hypothetical protein
LVSVVTEVPVVPAEPVPGSVAGGPVEVADDPVIPGLPAAVSVTVGLPFPPELESAFAPPPAPLGEVSEPTGEDPDGASVDCESAGVPVVAVRLVLVVEDVSLVLGVTWPAVATVVVPFGWMSAKAAGAERKSTTVAAETAAPPAHVRGIQLSDD